MSSEPQVVGSIASRSVEPGTRQTADRAVKLLRHQATYAPPTWSRGRDGFGIPRELRQLFESVRESTSSALEYVKKLVLVFVEELPGFEFFVQDGRV